MKTDKHSPTENPERNHYKKKYIQRKLEEKEAEDLIKQYKKVDTENPEPERCIRYD